jgi:hypothetical protein
VNQLVNEALCLFEAKLLTGEIQSFATIHIMLFNYDFKKKLPRGIILAAIIFFFIRAAL